MNEYQLYDKDFLTNDSKTNKRKNKKFALIIVVFTILSVVLLLTSFGLIFSKFKTPTKIIYKNPDTSIDVSSPIADDANISLLYEKCSPSTVYVSSTGIVGGFFNQKISLGDASGIIVSEDGYILTSASVVTSGADITVTFANSQKVSANLVGYDQKIDVALLKVDAQGLFPVVLGDSKNTKIGDWIVSIANPLAPTITNTLDIGIISGINKNVSLQKGVFLNILQTNLSMNNASPGSAVFNAEGEVIGIVLNISSPANTAFAIPINDIKPFLSSQLNIKSDITSQSDTPMLGITATEENYGVVVETVSENYPAAKAGIKVGDIIIKVDSVAVKTVEEINTIRTSHSRGDSMTLTIFRDGKTTDITVILE